MPTTTPAPNPPVLLGPIAQRFTRDEDGHRNYEVDWQIATDSQHHNLAHILDNWPLFAVGEIFDLSGYWPEAVGTDPWAFCTPTLNIAPHRDTKEQGPVFYWTVTQYWTTKQTWRCQTFPIENPLNEPFDISGDFVQVEKTASLDRFGKPLLHPNFQPITGPATEYKYSYPTVTISFNSGILPLSTFVNLINKVNDAPLWGLPARCVKFVDAKWQRKVYGSCFYYYPTTYTFECDRNGFDQEVPAQGTKEYGGSGPYEDPRSYIAAKSPSTGDKDDDGIPLDSLGRRLVFDGYDAFGVVKYKFPQKIAKPQVHHQDNLLMLNIPDPLT